RRQSAADGAARGPGTIGWLAGHARAPTIRRVFMLYAIGLGIAIGLALGGRLAALGTLQIRWARLAVAGLVLQLVLFAPAVTERVGDSGAIAYVGSSLVVLVVVLRNIALQGLP